MNEGEECLEPIWILYSHQQSAAGVRKMYNRRMRSRWNFTDASLELQYRLSFALQLA